MKSKFTREWIIDNSVDIIQEYEAGVLTLRGLHYRLVSIGMTNDVAHYKKVVTAMAKARWNGIVEFEAFSDHDRAMIGETLNEGVSLEDAIHTAKEQVEAWMTTYKKNLWENQRYYPEVFIEKRALQGVFKPICEKRKIALGACKGYPSLTFLNDAYQRFCEAESYGQIPVILYFGDYDPSGEDIPRSIIENLNRMGVDVNLERVSLNKEQVLEWELPPAPTKVSDTRSAKWGGFGQVELDAIMPDQLQVLCDNAISDYFNEDLHRDLIEIQNQEKITYQAELKEFVNNL